MVGAELGVSVIESDCIEMVFDWFSMGLDMVSGGKGWGNSGGAGGVGKAEGWGNEEGELTVVIEGVGMGVGETALGSTGIPRFWSLAT